MVLDLLVDYHKANMAISLADQEISKQDRPVTCKNTVGWQICCQWKDGSTSWEKLSKWKESPLVQTADVAVS